MSERHGYDSPSAYRRALTDRLKNTAISGDWTLPQLQRQVAYDRLLARVFRSGDQWILKGATALLARGIGVRATIDVDLYSNLSLERAERAVREAASVDLDDWFRFEAGPSHEVTDGAQTVRIPVMAFVGPTEWVRFHIDLVGPGILLTSNIDEASAIPNTELPGIERGSYLVYPLVDHVADKVVATFDRYGEKRVPSTRYKDLVDLVAIAASGSLPAEETMRALDAEATRRGVKLPTKFSVPDRSWESGYEAEARRSHLGRFLTLEEALDFVGPFLDPVLEGSATGNWDPLANLWI